MAAPISLASWGSFHVGGREVTITDQPAREVLFSNHPAIPTFPFPVKRLSSVLMDDLKGAHKYGG